MLSKIDALIAPQPLTAMEIAQVAAPNLAVYGVAHRAFIHARVLQQETDDAATCGAAEAALADIATGALQSVEEWLSDMESDETPRFYRKSALKIAMMQLVTATGRLFAPLEGYGRADDDVARMIALFEDRDEATLRALIDAAV